MKLTKNYNPDKYGYSGYDIGIDVCSQFTLTDRTRGDNVIIFGVDNSSSVHVDNKNMDIVALGEGLTQGLNDTKITGKAKFPINVHNRGEKITHPATRRRSDVVTTSLCTSSDVGVISQMKQPTMSPWNIAKTSQWYVPTTSYCNVVTTSQKDVTTTSYQCVSSTSQTSLK